MSYAPHNHPPHRPFQGAGFRRYEPNSMGIAGLIISIVGVVLTCGLLCPVGLLFSLVGLTKKPRGEAIAGTIIGGLGTLAVVAVVGFFVLVGSAAVNAERRQRNEQTTLAALDEAEAAIEEYRYDTTQLPAGIEGNKLVIPYTDAWGTSLRYEPEGDSYRIRSAGADQKFDTRDDVLSIPAWDREHDAVADKAEFDE